MKNKLKVLLALFVLISVSLKIPAKDAEGIEVDPDLSLTKLQYDLLIESPNTEMLIKKDEWDEIYAVYLPEKKKIQKIYKHTRKYFFGEFILICGGLLLLKCLRKPSRITGYGYVK